MNSIKQARRSSTTPYTTCPMRQAVVSAVSAWPWSPCRGLRASTGGPILRWWGLCGQGSGGLHPRTAYARRETDAEDTGSLAGNLAFTPGWRPLTAISLMAFIMFYAPCFVSVVCIARVAGRWKWAAFSASFNTALAFLLAVLLYQAGTIMGF